MISAVYSRFSGVFSGGSVCKTENESRLFVHVGLNFWHQLSKHLHTLKWKLHKELALRPSSQKQTCMHTHTHSHPHTEFTAKHTTIFNRKPQFRLTDYNNKNPNQPEESSGPLVQLWDTWRWFVHKTSPSDPSPQWCHVGLATVNNFVAKSFIRINNQLLKCSRPHSVSD